MRARFCRAASAAVLVEMEELYDYLTIQEREKERGVVVVVVIAAAGATISESSCLSPSLAHSLAPPCVGLANGLSLSLSESQRPSLSESLSF